MTNSFYSLHFKRIATLTIGNYYYGLWVGEDRSLSLLFVLTVYVCISAIGLMLFRSREESWLVKIPLVLVGGLLALNRHFDPIETMILPIVIPFAGEFWGRLLLTIFVFTAIVATYFWLVRILALKMNEDEN